VAVAVAVAAAAISVTTSADRLAVAVAVAAEVVVVVAHPPAAVLPPVAAATTMPTTAAAATTTSRSERMRASSLLTRAAVCWVALGAPLGCANKTRASDQASASAAPALADLPEPAGVVAELGLTHPDAALRALRELGSPLSALLPAGFPMFAATVLGLPPLNADSFDPDIAAVGVLAQNSKGELGWVVALHAVSGPELVAKLSTGDHAPFRAQTSEHKGLTLLQPSVGANPAAAPKPGLALAVFDNYLLATSDAELLSSVGPYTARMLPRRPPSHAALAVRVSQHALAGAVVPALRALWASYRTSLARQDQADRAAHGGRAPDFGDPSQVILGMDAGVESVLSVIEGATALELEIEPFSDRLELTLLLTPATGSPAQSLLATLGAGDAKGLLTMPVETRFALGLSRSPAERDEAGKVAGDDWVRLLGPRLSEHDAQTLRGVLADWELGRGAHTNYGFLAGAEPGVFVVADTADAPRLKRAGHGLFGLLGLPGVRAPFAEFLGQPRVSESVAGHTDFASDVQLAKINFAPAAAAGHAKPAAVPPLSCAWFVTEKMGFAAAGKDAAPVLEKVVLAARGSAASLGANANIAAGVQRIGEQAALFAYANAGSGAPAASGNAPVPPPAPVFFSSGKRENLGFLRIEISKPATDLALNRLAGVGL
jgi:hypothetical protein